MRFPEDVLQWLYIEPVIDKLRKLLALLDIKQFYPLSDYSFHLLFANLAVGGFEALDPLDCCEKHHIPAVFTFLAIHNYNRAIT